ncbi:MAG: hypothetical protein ACE5OS_08730 [Anaerolineae bacterium]
MNSEILMSGRQIPLFSSGWTQTEALIQNGGQAVEGIETISMDEYGDVVRTQFLITIQDGQFVTLAALEPAAP